MVTSFENGVLSNKSPFSFKKIPSFRFLVFWALNAGFWFLVSGVLGSGFWSLVFGLLSEPTSLTVLKKKPGGICLLSEPAGTQWVGACKKGIFYLPALQF